MQQAAVFRRDSQIGEVNVVLLFCGFVVCLRESAKSAGDIGVSSVRIV
jgi:hypothetical protein